MLDPQRTQQLYAQHAPFLRGVTVQSIRSGAAMIKDTTPDAVYALLTHLVGQPPIEEVVAYLSQQSCSDAIADLLSLVLWAGNLSKVDDGSLLTAQSMLSPMLARRHWRESGGKVYDVSPGLAERLLHTETRGLLGSDLRCPYASIYVTVPPGLLRSIDLGHDIEGMYLSLLESQGRPLLQIVTHSRATASPWVANGYVTMTLPLFPDQPISTAYNQRWERGVMNLDWTYSTVQTRDGDAEGIMRWAVNLLVYLTLPEAEVVGREVNKERRQLQERLGGAQGSKRERIKARLRTLEPDYRYQVGASLRALEVREAMEQRRSTSGIAPLVQTLVCGHYRNQACGPRWSERRLIWVQPFWRGVESSPVSNPVREVV